MTPLAQLIDAVKATNNWSDPVLVENARKQGHELTKSNISRYRNEDPLISIKGSIIRALAAGLRVSASQVAVAAVESMGIHLPSYELPTIEQSIRIDSTIPERDRQVIMAMVREVRTLGASLAKQPADPLAAEAPQPRTPGEAAESKKTGAGNPRSVNEAKAADSRTNLASRARKSAQEQRRGG